MVIETIPVSITRKRLFLKICFFMKTKYLIFIFLLCSKPVFAQKTSLSELDYQLYSVLINEWFCLKTDSADRQNFFGKWKKKKVNELVIRRKTGFCGILPSYTMRFNDSIYEKLIQNFMQQLSNTNEIEAQYLNKCIKITIFDSLKINQRQLGKFWKKFYRKYSRSNGIIELSNIAYDQTKTQALVGISINAYSLGAEGYLIIFENRNGRWNVKKYFMIWQA